MLIHEIHSCYYKAVSRILAEAQNGELSWERVEQIAKEEAFAESPLTIRPALETGKWQLLDGTLHTPLRAKPNLPLTTLEKRWLKAISLDVRIRLFDPDLSFLETVEPLFTPEDYVIFDRYSDGDPYGEELYRQIFRSLLKAVRCRKSVRVQYRRRNGERMVVSGVPYKLEYSEKDDKFRVLLHGRHSDVMLNVGRIQECVQETEPGKERTGDERWESSRDGREECAKSLYKNYEKLCSAEYLILELTDSRNTLERVMLHFAHFKKETERIGKDRYRMKLYYDPKDEMELLMRVLSFGPLVQVTEPAHFVNLIKERLVMQKSCGLK